MAISVSCRPWYDELRRRHTMKVPVRPMITTAATSVPAATDAYLLEEAMLAPCDVVRSFSEATALRQHHTLVKPSDVFQNFASRYP